MKIVKVFLFIQLYLWLNLTAEAAAPYFSCRPEEKDRLFRSEAVEQTIETTCQVLTHPKLRWMFSNCFPNTLDTTVHFGKDENGSFRTFVYTGDIHAMWLRDSGAQVWPYVSLAVSDLPLRNMIAGVIRCQFSHICLDPYANAFNDGPVGGPWQNDFTDMNPFVHERKWEVDSPCYPIRLAYRFWRTTSDTSIFDSTWLEAMRKIYETFKAQQRREGDGPYHFQREARDTKDTKACAGYGYPVKPVGLIASSFRPSDDATMMEFLVPSNFFAVTSLRKAAEILETVNHEMQLARDCLALADEVEDALRRYAIYPHPKYGPIYAYEVDGFGGNILMDDANVPSLLAMAYLGDVSMDDPVWQNTRRFVWSEDNPFFFKGKIAEGIGGPHIGKDMIWPMSIMMRAFTSRDDDEIAECMQTLLDTDAGTGFIHESFHKDDAGCYTRPWFAWQNTLFGELVLKLIADGKLDLLNRLK